MIEKIGLGIIGCGIAANDLHWPAIDILRDKFEITAVCNHTEEKAKLFSKKTGEAYLKDIPFFTDYRDLLAQDNVNAVVILLPIDLNLEVCTKAAEAGKHIIVEKPIAVNTDEAGKLLLLEKKYPDLVMMVAENFRYKPIFSVLKDTITSGTIGKPYYVEWRCWTITIPAENKYARTKWRINHNYDGGFITDGGIHNIAALRDLFGELTINGAHKSQVNPNIGKEDTFSTLFTTGGKGNIPPVHGLLQLFFSVNGKSDFTLRVLGSDGTLEIKGDNIILYNTGDKEGSIIATEPDGGGYVNEYLDFYTAVTNNSGVLSSFNEGYKDLQTILHALKEAKS